MNSLMTIRLSLIIAETLKQYLYVFEENKIPNKKNNLVEFFID